MPNTSNGSAPPASSNDSSRLPTRRFEMTRRDRELNDEINSHLDEATEEYIAKGMSAEQARVAAMRDFGGVTQTAQVYRESRRFAWVDDLAQDLRYTFRRLIKTPAFKLIVIATTIGRRA